MRTEAPALIPVLRSRVQGELLAELLLHPTAELSIRELSRRVGASVSTVHAEVERLVTARILDERTEGRSRLLRAGAAPVVRPLTEVVALTFGPLPVLADEFRDVPGVDRVLIFGSWAARYHGAPGPPPHDVDVLVVGEPKRPDVYAAADRAERRLRREVNPFVVTAARLSTDDSPLLRQVRASPTVDVIGEEER